MSWLTMMPPLLCPPGVLCGGDVFGAGVSPAGFPCSLPGAGVSSHSGCLRSNGGAVGVSAASRRHCWPLVRANSVRSVVGHADAGLGKIQSSPAGSSASSALSSKVFERSTVDGSRGGLLPSCMIVGAGAVAAGVLVRRYGNIRGCREMCVTMMVFVCDPKATN